MAPDRITGQSFAGSSRDMRADIAVSEGQISASRFSELYPAQAGTCPKSTKEGTLLKYDIDAFIENRLTKLEKAKSNESWNACARRPLLPNTDL